jgi:hypothetical protein
LKKRQISRIDDVGSRKSIDGFFIKTLDEYWISRLGNDQDINDNSKMA